MLKRIGYSTRAINIIESNLNIGELKSPDICISNESSCGEYLVIYLSISNDIISDAKFQYIGCAGLQLAASAITKLVKGVSLESAITINADNVIDYLEKVPKQKVACIEFAVTTLKKALVKYRPEVGS
ncbi:iron-sulfur cluster assembly scaffold protein [Candidatus Neomarinimicrobiota bacterium]